MIHEFESDRGTNVVWYIINKISKLHFGSTALLQYTGYTDVCLVRFAIISIYVKGSFKGMTKNVQTEYVTSHNTVTVGYCLYISLLKN